jgi:hypothetical protein
VLGVLSTGCLASTAEDPGATWDPVETSETAEARDPTRTGYITLRWSIEYDTSAGLCKLFGATQLELIVYEPNQKEFGRVYRPCSDFEVTMPIPVGLYSANATLVNAWAQPVSTTLPISAIRITPNEALAIRADFPAASRLPPR